MRAKKFVSVVAAILLVVPIVATVSADEPAQPTKQKARAASKLYGAFDAHKLLEKYVSHFDKAPRHTNVVTNIKISPPGDHFKLFRIKGNISDDALDDLLQSLQTELTDLAKTSGVDLTHKPKTTVGDRPIQLLTVLFLGETVELKTLRGFYLTYEQGRLSGAIDTFAVRCVDEDTKHWKIVCTVHESTR